MLRMISLVLTAQNDLHCTFSGIWGFHGFPLKFVRKVSCVNAIPEGSFNNPSILLILYRLNGTVEDVLESCSGNPLGPKAHFKSLCTKF